MPTPLSLAVRLGWNGAGAGGGTVQRGTRRGVLRSGWRGELMLHKRGKQRH